MKQIEIYTPVKPIDYKTVHKTEYSRLKRIENEMNRFRNRAWITLYTLSVLLIGTGIGIWLIRFTR